MSDSSDRSKPAAVEIRRADPADAELLATIGARTFEETFGPDNTPEDMAAYVTANFTPAKLAGELADAATCFLIAEVDGVTAGYATLRWGGDDGVIGAKPIELRRIYAGREWHGRGVGVALMHRCLDEAAEMGADVLWLGVWERNERAIAFYLKSGFVKVGEHDFVLGSDRQTDWVMARRL